MTKKAIEKDVAVPTNSESGLGRPLKYPWNRMKEGDSFLVSDEDAIPASISSAGIRYFERNDKPLKVIYRTVDGGFRFWAIAK
jgi:hypothetical protein